jgi:ATP-binding cassette subfamily C protein
MTERPPQPGLPELRAARRSLRGLFWFAALFSIFVNLLMLTGPIYMLQVYDRVLGSRSVETLVALTALVAFLFIMMGILDFARARIMGRAGARFQGLLERRVFDAVLRRAAVSPDDRSAGGLNDLRSVQGLLTSPVFMAFFDIPFTPLFLAGIWIFHPWLGMLALGGGAILILVALANQITTRHAQADAARANQHADALASQIQTEAETVQATGMRGAAFNRWQKVRGSALGQQMSASDNAGLFTTSTKAFRLFLQSAMLGLAAFLVLRGELTPGAMIAGSILLGRALAPIEMLVGQWPAVQRARQGWSGLATLLERVHPEGERTELPQPRAHLAVLGVTVVPPGDRQPALRGVNFTLEPGRALGVIGPSGAGKSTLARAVTGLWAPASGRVQLDGASLDQYAPDTLGRHIGYLPQRVQLFEGTIAENIARLAETPNAEAVVAAARRADAHQMITGFPDGYDTRITAGGGRLSGGQIQRIGLARAMYGDPVILVLDEPNSNLDNEGSDAVNTAIRSFKKEGKSVIIVAHRPAAIKECDMLLMLEGGSVRSFGPKDDVLREVVNNRSQITDAAGKGGVQ